jgi:hypothetical protein|tara:strand:+ start:209 stop:694 length:486 start_codon:yes stop_codon:yes gene_type:complete
MQFKNNSKQRFKSIQGLRSFKDTLPKNIKKLINKRGHIFSETLNNWKHIAGEDLFKVCYPKAYRSSNKFGVSTLLIMVKRGHEIELEYSKKKIMDKMNFFFQNQVVERIKFKSFNDEKSDKKENEPQSYETKNRFEKNLTNVENESLKKSLIELTKVFKTK